MYAGSEGPLLCLKDRVADVGFMRSVDLEYLTTSHHGEAPAYDPNVGFLFNSPVGSQHGV